MGRHLFPRSDDALAAWSANMLQILAAEPAVYGISPQELARQTLCTEAFRHWLARARGPARRRMDVTRKNTAREALKTQTRRTLRIVNAQVDLTQTQRARLGLSLPRDRPPLTPPAEAPALHLIDLAPTSLRMHIHRLDSTALRRPQGVSGAVWWVCMKNDPPPDVRDWRWLGATHQRRVTLDFDPHTPPGTRIHVAAAWMNRLLQIGPISQPLLANLPGATHWDPSLATSPLQAPILLDEAA